MKEFLKSLLIFTITSSSLWAATALDGINQDDLNAIGKEFAGNFSHSPVMPPVSLGDVFGLELGVVAGLTETPEFDRLVKEQDPNAKLEQLIHAGFIAGIGFPAGFTGEIIVLPSLGSSAMTLSNTSFALRWDIGQYLMKGSGLKLAARIHHSSSNLSFSQTDGSGFTGTVNFDTTTTGAHVLTGFDLSILQPYLGLGFISGGTDVTLTGSGTIFDTTLTQTNSAESSQTSLHWLAGMQFDLIFLHLGVEYQSFFDTSKFTGKVSLAF